MSSPKIGLHENLRSIDDSERVVSDYRYKRLQGDLYGITIAVTVRSLDAALFGRLVV